MMPLTAIVGNTPPSLARDARFASKVLGVRLRIGDLARAARGVEVDLAAFAPLPTLVAPGERPLPAAKAITVRDP